MNYEITNFSTDVIERSHTIPVLVDFWAEWCAPCKVLGPILERLAEAQKDNWVLAKADIDKHQEIAAEYGIRSIPNTKLFVDGQVVNEFVGALPEYTVVKWLEKAVPDKFRKDIEKAQRLILEEHVSEGQAILEQVLSRASGNAQARVLLAGTYLDSDRKRALELVAEIDEGSEHFPVAEAIQTISTLVQKMERPQTLPEDPVKQMYLDAIRELSRKNFDGAVEKFIRVIQDNRYYDKDGARRACLAIFRILGEEHEITRKHRRNFGSALNI